MNRIKFYALCTRNLDALKRHQKYIPKEDLCIIINTTEGTFASDAKEYCVEQGIESYITFSDGTASTGKNSFFDTFLASDNDYAILIDGDDFITPHGVWTYKQLAESGNFPDALSLEYQYGIYPLDGYDHEIFGGGLTNFPFSMKLGSSNYSDPDQLHGMGKRIFLMPYNWWEAAKEGTLIPITEEDTGFQQKWRDTHHEWVSRCYKYINKWETHCRLVGFSRKAAGMFRFDPEFVVGEDTIMWFDYKHQHYLGNLVLKSLFDVYPTYVYDIRVPGVVDENRDKGGKDKGWCNWLVTLNAAYAERENEGKLHEFDLPKITVCEDSTAEGADLDADIVWPEGYKPNVLGLVNYPVTKTIKYV